MSRKHNTRHQRGRSRYPDRLRARGVTNVDVRMTPLEQLRRRHNRRHNPATDTVTLLEEILIGGDA